MSITDVKVSKALILQNPPTTVPDLSLGGEKSTFKLVEQDIPELQEGQYLVKTVYLSNDPAQRLWMQKETDAARGYVPPVRKGDVMNSVAIGKVVDSKSSSYSVDDLVLGQFRWTEYSVQDEKPAVALPVAKINAIPGFSPTIFLGAFGTTGLTAFFGLTDILKLEKGQSIVISGAAGAVGYIAVQYAKHVIGASKVVAISGSDEKVEWVKKLGADISLNYKHPEFKKQLDDATEGFVDAYFDNVGGEVLDQMLTRVKQHGRIAASGAISIYNSLDSTHLHNYSQIITNRLILQSFIVIDYLPRYAEAIAVLSSAVKAGKLDVKHGETLVHAKFEDIPKTWGILFDGGNTGKLVTQIASLD